MSKRWRWTLIVLGTIQVFLAMFFGASSVYMQSSASYMLIAEKEEKLIEALKSGGAIFSDEEQARLHIREELGVIPDVISRGMAFAGFVLGANGLFLVIFGAWPRTNRDPAAVLDTGSE